MARVLFVCLGNICRSPMAEGALRHAALAHGLDWTIDSAGTGNWHAGEPPDPRAQAMAALHGVDISGLRARAVHPHDFERFDLVLAMDYSNLANLRRLAPARPGLTLSLALDQVPGRAGEAVADPYYDDESGFLRSWRDTEAIANALIRRALA